MRSTVLPTKAKRRYEESLLFAQEFHEELSSKAGEVEKLLKSLPTSTALKGARSTARPASGRPSTGHGSDSPAASAVSPAASAATGLQRKWTTVSRMSAERSRKLLDMYNRLLEVGPLPLFSNMTSK